MTKKMKNLISNNNIFKLMKLHSTLNKRHYGSHFGLLPSATWCPQLFSSHNMLAMALDAANPRLYVETFRVPTSCICHAPELRQEAFEPTVEIMCTSIFLDI